MRSDIADTRNFVEKCSPKRLLSPEREQLMQLYSLGLSEQEAVEYTLMLSRDEELLRRQSGTGGHVDEGIFEMDEISRSQAEAELSSASSSSLWEYSPPLRTSSFGSCTSSHGHIIPMASHSNSNIKVQVSPRFKPEPKEAGGLLGDPPEPQSTLPQGSLSRLPSRPISQSTRRQTSPRVITSSKQVCNVGTSSGKPNAWSKPLRGAGSSVPPPAQASQFLPSPHLMDREVEAERIRRVEDPELRFALEMSLAEAQSRERDAGGT
jgi:hypothetical protein